MTIAYDGFSITFLTFSLFCSLAESFTNNWILFHASSYSLTYFHRSVHNDFFSRGFTLHVVFCFRSIALLASSQAHVQIGSTLSQRIPIQFCSQYCLSQMTSKAPSASDVTHAVFADHSKKEASLHAQTDNMRAYCFDVTCSLTFSHGLEFLDENSL